MNQDKQAALEAAGFRIGDVADFLGLSPAEERVVEFRVALCRAVRALRVSCNRTQKQLAELIGSSQPRVAAIEACAPGVSTDLALRGFFALGGDLAALAASTQASRESQPTAKAKRTTTATPRPRSKPAPKPKKKDPVMA